jgi:hypothetical protein
MNKFTRIISLTACLLISCSDNKKEKSLNDWALNFVNIVKQQDINAYKNLRVNKDDVVLWGMIGNYDIPTILDAPFWNLKEKDKYKYLDSLERLHSKEWSKNAADEIRILRNWRNWDVAKIVKIEPTLHSGYEKKLVYDKEDNSYKSVTSYTNKAYSANLSLILDFGNNKTDTLIFQQLISKADRDRWVLQKLRLDNML